VELGVNGSLWLARLLSIAMIAFLVWLFLLLQLGGFFLAGIILSSLLLFYEHWLLRKGDLEKLDMAFFSMNGYISIIIFVATLLEMLTARGSA
jgi:4-hydroxybenzoate polyprenyltransferase